MSYTATWSNADVQGRLTAGVHAVRLSDPQELAEAINRRCLLVYKSQEDYSGQVQSGAFVNQSTINGGGSPPVQGFRDALAQEILEPAPGGLGGTPPTPASMEWLWPVADENENKVIVNDAGGVGEGQIGLFQQLNGTTSWTDPVVTGGETRIRSVHFNEFRQVVEYLRRGRWELPIYFAAGIFSILPDTPWITEAIANNGTDELRSLGFAVICTDESPARGLANVTVRSDSRLELTVDTDCDVEVFRCLRGLEFVEDPPTWNEFAPGESLAWQTPGATGPQDAVLIGSIQLSADTPGSISNAALTEALQAMIGGSEQNFLVRRSDTGAATVSVTGRLVIEFDLDSPPN